MFKMNPFLALFTYIFIVMAVVYYSTGIIFLTIVLLILSFLIPLLIKSELVDIVNVILIITVLVLFLEEPYKRDIINIEKLHTDYSYVKDTLIIDGVTADFNNERVEDFMLKAKCQPLSITYTYTYGFNLKNTIVDYECYNILTPVKSYIRN